MGIRVRVAVEAPAAQFLVPVDAGASLAELRERIALVLSRRFGKTVDGSMTLSVDDYELMDEFGTDVLRDGEVVRCVHTVCIC